MLAPSVTRRLIKTFAGRDPTQPDSITTLTPPEREVLKLVAQGLSTSESADTLTVSRATFKTNVANSLDKLHARDRVQAAAIATTPDS
jgi:DNA-binding NarL/FixJ family response regulator